MNKWILRFLNGCINFAVSIILLVTLLYSGYALWDNNQVYARAESVLDEIRSAGARRDSANPTMEKPMIKGNADVMTEKIRENDTEPPAQPEELTPLQAAMAINQDVAGWIIVPGTEIDYPVLQGKTNMTYLNRDIQGNYTMTGSIFLDSRNQRDYSDIYSLLYGHNMSKHRMFSDINLFKDEAFFKNNQQAILLLPDGEHVLQSISCFLTSAADSLMLNPENWKEFSNEQILQAVQENAMFVSEDGIAALKTLLEKGRKPAIISLSTCSSEFTDARTLLLTLMDPLESILTPAST